MIIHNNSKDKNNILEKEIEHYIQKIDNIHDVCENKDKDIKKLKELNMEMDLERYRIREELYELYKKKDLLMKENNMLSSDVTSLTLANEKLRSLRSYPRSMDIDGLIKGKKGSIAERRRKVRKIDNDESA